MTKRSSTGGSMLRAVKVAFAGLLAATALGAQESIRKDSAAGDVGAVSRSAPAEIKVRSLLVSNATNGEPIEGVEVRDSLTGRTRKTDREGRVSMSFLSDIGASVLAEVRKPGFRPVHMFVAKRDSMDFGILLEPNPLGSTSLPPMIITDRRSAVSFAGFEERCTNRTTSCIRQADLEYNPSKTLGDFLVQTGDVRVVCTGGSSTATRGVTTNGTNCTQNAFMLGSTGGLCQPTYFVDGFENAQATQSGSKLGQIGQDYPTTNIKGVEVYRAEERRPLRLNGDSRCGVIAIWLK